eukprot:4692950-Ditylum_brightwellii.AAC.1
MAGCTDFVEEETLLLQRACQLGENLVVSVVVDCTPKGHLVQLKNLSLPFSSWKKENSGAIPHAG